jgi:hypothetical protein
MALFDYDPLGYTQPYDAVMAQPQESAGLLGSIKKYMADPRNQAGLAAFGRALAQAGAPRRGPLTWGGGLSDAFAGMNEGRQAYDMQAQDKAMKKAQLDALMEKLKHEQFKGKLLTDAFQPGQQAPMQPAPMQQSTMGPPGDEMPPQPSQPMPQQGGFMAGINPNKLAAMELAGISGAKNVFDIYKYINDGIKREPGATYKNPMTGQETHYPSLPQGFTRNPQGQVSLAPGFNEANDQLKRTETLATEGAKANFDFVQVPDGRGGTRMMSKAEATRSLGGGDAGYSNPAADAANKAKMEAEATLAPKSIELSNKTFMDGDYKGVIDKGTIASQSISQAKIARGALDNLGGTNWATPAKVAGAKVLNVIGIPNAEKIASNGELFKSTLFNHVLAKQLDQKGPQTESDAQRIGQTYAQLSNTTRANNFLLDTIEAQAELDKRRETFYRKALPIAQKSGNLAEIGDEWTARAPSIFDMPSMTKWKK